MHRILLSLVAAAPLLTTVLYSQSPAGPWAVADVKIVDVDRGVILDGMTVVITDGIIAALQPFGEPVPPGTRLMSLDERAYYLVPGLIDAHVHFLDSTGARGALVSGVTTARNMGTAKFLDVTLRDQGSRNPGLYPEVLAAGYHLQRRVPQDLVALHPELQDLALDSVATEQDLRRLASVQLEHDIDVLKAGGDYQLAPARQPGIWRRRWLRFLRWLGLAPEPAEQSLSAFGLGPDYQPMFSESDFTALVEEAGNASIGLAVHAHGDASARSAAIAGALSIEHGTYLTDSTLAIMADLGVYLVPSLSRTEWRGHAYLDRVRAVAREAHRKEVPLAAGTDAQYTEGAPALAGELQAMERAGIPRHDALRAGTLGAAQLLGVDDRTGRMAVSTLR